MVRTFGLAVAVLTLPNCIWAQSHSNTLRLASAKQPVSATTVVNAAYPKLQSSEATNTRDSSSVVASDHSSRTVVTTTKMMPFNSQSPWLHGFGSRQPVFSGLYRFRPSNYKQALARDSYLRMHGAASRNQFWARYQSSPTKELARPVAIQPVRSQPRLISATKVGPRVANGMMSPIHSIEVATPRRLRHAPMTQPSAIRHAVQREQTGPLFPLPK